MNIKQTQKRIYELYMKNIDILKIKQICLDEGASESTIKKAAKLEINRIKELGVQNV